MERGDIGMLAAQPANSGVNGKVDGDTVPRFATSCRALGIAIYERKRPADLAETEQRRRGLAARIAERPELVELELGVEGDQRRLHVTLADGDGDVQLRRALGNRDHVDCRPAERAEEAIE